MSETKKFKSALCTVLALVLLFTGMFALPGSAKGTNLSLNKNVSASSQYTWDYCVTNAVDGDYDTSWYASSDDENAYYILDLGAAYNISQIKIYWGIYDYATAYALYFTTSANPTANDWAPLSYTATNTMKQAHYISDLTLDETIRQIKIVCNGKNDWSYEIFEVETYEKASAEPTITVPEEEPTTPEETTVPETGDSGTQEPTAPATEVFEASRDMNHTYVPYEWLAYAQTEAQINKHLDTLEEHEIKYLLCDIGLYEYDYSAERLTNTIKHTNLAKWIKLAHQRGMIVNACVNISFSDKLADGSTTTAEGKKLKNQVVALTKKLVVTGLTYQNNVYYVDGMHFDAEPFDKMYQPFLVTMLKAVKAVTSVNGKMISLYSPAKNGLWTNAYLKKIANIVDMLNPALYDSNGPTLWGSFADGVTQTAAQYRELCRVTCLWYSENISASENPDCLLSPTVPVYDDRKIDNNVGVGFPARYGDSIYYHLNYNEITGEELESLDNAVTGINLAIQGGAKVYSAGVFYWPAFIGEFKGYTTDVNPYYDYEDDINDWHNNWING